MAELTWKEAIVKVLTKEAQPMHYTDIAQAIAAEGLRTNLGATPASSVSATLVVSLQKEGVKSPFVKIGGGIYTLKTTKVVPPPTEQREATGFLNAFGMYWKRGYVIWKGTPMILGQQQLGSKPVDFCQQKGVYLLHDGSKVVYVGRSSDQVLGVRLNQHTNDRLNGRWDRFSWFGIFDVQDDGSLKTTPPSSFNVESLIATMEALLIEGLEPPQNRKRGDDFSAVEFLQVQDPEIQKSEMNRLLEKLKAQVS